MANWQKASANDLKVGRRVRITYHDGTFVFVGRVAHKWRGWNARIEDEGRTYIVSKHFSDWGTYDIEVR